MTDLEAIIFVFFSKNESEWSWSNVHLIYTTYQSDRSKWFVKFRNGFMVMQSHNIFILWGFCVTLTTRFISKLFFGSEASCVWWFFKHYVDVYGKGFYIAGNVFLEQSKSTISTQYRLEKKKPTTKISSIFSVFCAHTNAHSTFETVCFT